MALVSTLASVEHEAVNHLPMPAVWFGITALIFFAILLAITFSYRGMWHRHEPSAVEGHDSAHSSGHGGH